MMRAERITLMAASLLALLAIAAPHGAAAQDQTRDQLQTQDRLQDQTRDRLQTRTQDQVYGSQLMTSQERAAYRDRLRAAHTEQERERIRAEHHEAMQARARERGLRLPDMPPAPLAPGRAFAPRGGSGPAPFTGGGGRGR